MSKSEASLEEGSSYFRFRLGGANYVCQASNVEAVTSFEEPLALPRVPPHVLGLVTYDQRALVIVDARAFLHLTASDGAEFRHTAVVNAGPYRVGIPVEGVLGMVKITPEQLQPSAGVFTGTVAGYVTAVAGDEAGTSGVLDLDRLLENARV